MVSSDPKQIAQAVKLAHKLGLEIKIEKLVFNTHIEISGLPLGCGIGEVRIHVPKSHRKYKFLKETVDLRHVWGDEYAIDNISESIAAVRATGGSLIRGKPIVARFIVVCPEQKRLYELAYGLSNSANIPN